MIDLHEMDEQAVIPPIPLAQPDGTREKHSKFNKLSTNVHQNAQIEKYKLDFLLEMRTIKRPPPSLRCTGFKALEEEERISLISEIETKSLQNAFPRRNMF